MSWRGQQGGNDVGFLSIYRCCCCCCCYSRARQRARSAFLDRDVVLLPSSSGSAVSLDDVPAEAAPVPQVQVQLTETDSPSSLAATAPATPEKQPSSPAGGGSESFFQGSRDPVFLSVGTGWKKTTGSGSMFMLPFPPGPTLSRSASTSPMFPLCCCFLPFFIYFLACQLRSGCRHAHSSVLGCRCSCRRCRCCAAAA